MSEYTLILSLMLDIVCNGWNNTIDDLHFYELV